MRITNQILVLHIAFLSWHIYHLTNTVVMLQSVEFAEGRTLKMTTEVFDEVNRTFHSDLTCILSTNSRAAQVRVRAESAEGLIETTPSASTEPVESPSETIPYP